MGRAAAMVEAAGGGSGAILCLFCFRILLLAALASGGRWPSVQLEATVTVRRGLAADVNPIITGLGEDSQHCIVRQVPQTEHLSCGGLRPSSVHCDTPGTLVYQHYGCSSTRDLLHLQLLASRNGSTADEQYVRFFLVEVVVEDYSGRLVELETTSRLSEGYTYTQLTPVFPPEWVGRCYYRIVRSLLPTADLQGMVNSPLPCGYVPREPFLLLEDARQNRSILMEVTGMAPSMPETLRVVLFANSTVPERPPALPRTSLQVLQFSHTPMPPNTLPCPHSSSECIYVFPVLSAGAFVPAYSPSTPQGNITKFTSEDIAAGTVVFVPSDSQFTHGTFQPTVTDTYEYAIFDYANHMLAQSVVEVTVFSVDWNYPSLRFVASPRVESGGSVSLDDSHLQFYIEPNGYCARNTHVSLARNPSHGMWSFVGRDGSGGGVGVGGGRNLAIGEPFSHSLLQNGTLVYQHDGHGSTTADATIWNVTCSGRTFQLGMTLLIISEKSGWSSMPRVQPSTLITFCGRASPLLLDIPLYSNHSLRFDVNASRGAVVRLNSAPNMLSADLLPPYIASSGLVLGERVTQFAFEELQRSLIWYIPECSASNWLEVSIHRAQQHTPLQSPVRVLVLYSTVALEDFFLLSTAGDFLRVVKNQPLPVASAKTAVYITTTFLYTRSDVDSPSTITYRLLEPPRYGHLCPASLEPHLCTQSVPRFTQADVDRFKIVYRPVNTSHLLFRQNNDSFSFELLHRGVGLARWLTGVFHMFAAQVNPLVASESQLWVEPTEELTIPPRLFRYSGIKPHRTATFRLLALPQFGELLMPQKSPPTVLSLHPYTFDELRRGRLQYRHRGPVQSCNDSFTFSASNSTHNVNKTVVIAVRQRQDDLLGMWQGTKSVLGQENFVFTSQDFRVLSDFCLQFVQFMVKTEPVLGLLRLFQPSLHTFVQLRNESVFSAEDVRDGRLWYMATHRHPNSSASSNSRTSTLENMKFYLSDPKNFGNPSRNVNSKIRIDFEVTFLQPTEIRIHTVFDTRDIYVLSWVPELGKFGYVFRPDDIRAESTPDLNERDISVKILIKESPRKGWIRRRGQPVTEFYLHQLREGQIYYVPNNWWIWVTSSDAFTMSILLETSNASSYIDTIYNHSMALVWSWVNPVRPSYLVSESASTLQVFFRRRVDNGTCPDYQSNFSLALSPSSNATLATFNCSNSGGWWMEDACIDSLHLSFPPGQCETSVSVWLRQDLVLEGSERLLLYLTNCSNCVSNVSLAQPMEIVIDDTRDYAFVDVLARPTATAPYGCSREAIVREQEGQLVLELTRSGNMEREVTVSCLTQPDTAADGVDFGGLHREESTIAFAPNQTRGRCAVEIYDDTTYEGKERFYVFVRGRAGELVNSRLEETPLCVYIVYDPNDAPIVEFQRRPLVVSERDSVSFSVLRRGFNLHLLTAACYQLLPNASITTATLSEDFSLMSGCVQSHDHWCVTFTPNQTKVTCSVFARPDNLLEGTETVFLQLLPGLQFGELGRITVLNITIIDRTEPAHIGLESDVFHIDEGEGLQRFPVSRSGSVNGVNKILCKLKPIDATAQITDEERADFVVPRTPETVTFQPFNTTEYCSMWLRDDSVYEGVERLYLELDYSPQDPRVQIVPSRKKATIYIHDTEDEPKVWFVSTSYTVQEPLSNFEVDRRCALLTLNRSGDTSGPSSVAYTTLGGSARPGEHFVGVSGTVLFEPGEETRNITVPILASEDSRQVSFSVRLLGNVTTPPGAAPRPATTAEQEEASVVILNTPVAGVLFPDRPVVLSLLPDGTYATGHALYYNAPVVCVDPCDEDFVTVDEEASSYAAYCRDQQIDSGLTKYTWFISSNSPSPSSEQVLEYRPVEQATVFTSFDGKVLEPVYLNHSSYVRCSAQAITRLGTLGGTRLSEGVYLSRSLLSSAATGDTCGSVSSFFDLHGNDGFTGHPEELLMLTVVLKHHDNYIPLVSSRPFDLSDGDLLLSLLTRPFSRSQHSCSSLVESGPRKASFLSPLLVTSSSPQPPSTRIASRIRAAKSQLLYQHLNASKCQWEFNVWLPLSLLTDSAVCDGQLLEEGQRLTLTLPLYHTYVHLHRNRGVSILPLDSPHSSDIVRASWPSGHRLSIPFDTYPHTSSGALDNTSSVYIYPITTRLARGQLTVTFYSVSNATAQIIRVEASTGESTLPGQLLYSSTSSFSGSPPSSAPAAPASSDAVRQAWMLTGIPRDEEGSLALSLWLSQCPSGSGVGLCVSTSPLSFTWSIATADSLEPRIAPQMNGVVTVFDGLIEGSIWLRPYFRLRANHTVNLERTTLYRCAESADNTSCTHSQIWELANHDKKVVLAEGFDMKAVGKTATSTNFTIQNKPLQELELTGLFQLHIKSSIRNTSDGPNSALSPIPLLVLSFRLPGPTQGLSPKQSSGVSHSVALLASIIIFLMVAVLVVVVLVVVGLFWRWQARHKQVRSSRTTENSCSTDGGAERREGEEGGTWGCGSATQECAAVGLRKSSSTTSFPTAEKLKTLSTQQQPSLLDSGLQGTTSQMTGQIDRHPVLSKSLPNLLLASTREGKLSRKRQLRKNVRVKAIYSLQASLDKRRGKAVGKGGGGGGGGRGEEGTATVLRGEGNTKREEAVLKTNREREEEDLQVCVIKNTPVLVRVQPLTGEVDVTRHSTASDLKPEDFTPTTAL